MTGASACTVGEDFGLTVGLAVAVEFKVGEVVGAMVGGAVGSGLTTTFCTLSRLRWPEKKYAPAAVPASNNPTPAAANPNRPFDDPRRATTIVSSPVGREMN